MNVKGDQQCLPPRADEDRRSAWDVVAACPTAQDREPGQGGWHMQLAVGLSCVHRAAQRVRLLGARHCPVGCPLDVDLGILWGGTRGDSPSYRWRG